MQNWIYWLGHLHPAVIHFPIVCPILALIALVFEFYWRKPWLSQIAAALWVITFFTSIVAFISGHGLSLQLGIVPQWSWAPPESALHGQLREHALWGSFSLIFSLIVLVAAWKIFRNRSWSLSVNLFLGLILTISFGLTGYNGGEMVYGFDHPSVPIATDANFTLAAPGDLFDSLGHFHETMVKMNTRPWNSRAHGRRWINTYVSKESVKDYKNTNPLPIGSLVVLETFEDENNQPSSVPGPLYLMKKGPLADSPRTKGWLYALRWDHPVANNPERIKEAVEWLPGDAHLNACLKCHSRFKDEDYMGGIPEGYQKP
jgi:uncharacterized membrane protein